VLSLMRAGVLTGAHVVVSAPPSGGPFGAAVAQRAAALGAAVRRLAVDPSGGEAPFEGAADVLVWDGAAAFAAAGLRGALDGAWLAVRSAATAVMTERGGRVVLIAPPPGGPDAEAARAGLENLARTLSIEWARFGVRTVAVHPGAPTSAAEVAELVAFLASPAGDYYSGCRFSLGESAA
jgi:hypothetical protein